ncbi:MAG: DUF2237 domain-containing protein [Henriciella sp.]|nr:DUF2237 domain-containing protein [Henriciella sp.]MBO6694707.1 DUF2237 domain-containing protein [Henriciella sp.]
MTNVVKTAKNVLGNELASCSQSPLTGFFRDGCCNTGPMDHGMHTVCVTVTAEFLQYSFNRGNDLITPRPEFQFPGLKPGDKWCLCASRWEEARQMGVAPPVDLSATHYKTLSIVDLAHLKAHAEKGSIP